MLLRMVTSTPHPFSQERPRKRRVLCNNERFWQRDPHCVLGRVGWGLGSIYTNHSLSGLPSPHHAISPLSLPPAPRASGPRRAPASVCSRVMRHLSSASAAILPTRTSSPVSSPFCSRTAAKQSPPPPTPLPFKPPRQALRTKASGCGPALAARAHMPATQTLCATSPSSPTPTLPLPPTTGWHRPVVLCCLSASFPINNPSSLCSTIRIWTFEAGCQQTIQAHASYIYRLARGARCPCQRL